MTWQELLLKGGPVVWVLAGYSVLGLAIVLERLVYFLRLGPPLRDPADLPRARGRRARGPEASVMRAMDEARQNGVRDPAGVGARVRGEQLQRMESGFRTLAILGNTAPLLGLLGTILGMIKAFMVIEAAGGKVDSQALAGGIWEAMVTTGAGLSVAIPLLILLHFLEGRAERRAHSMQRCIDLAREREGRQTPDQPDDELPRWEEMTDAV